MDGAGSYSVAHTAGLLPTELTGMWGWILLRSPHQGRGSPPAPAPTQQRPAPPPHSTERPFDHTASRQPFDRTPLSTMAPAPSPVKGFAVGAMSRATSTRRACHRRPPPDACSRHRKPEQSAGDAPLRPRPVLRVQSNGLKTSFALRSGRRCWGCYVLRWAESSCDCCRCAPGLPPEPRGRTAEYFGVFQRTTPRACVRVSRAVDVRLPVGTASSFRRCLGRWTTGSA